MDSFKTKRLNLRRIEESDFDFFYSLIQDSSITKYFVSFENLDDPKQYFLETIIGQQNHGNLFLLVCNKANTPLGIINAFYTANGTWLVEYALHEKYRNRGYMVELLTHICQNDFEFMSVFKTNQNSIFSLIFEVKPENIASRKVLSKVAKTLNLKTEIGDDNYEIFI